MEFPTEPSIYSWRKLKLAWEKLSLPYINFHNLGKLPIIVVNTKVHLNIFSAYELDGDEVSLQLFLYYYGPLIIILRTIYFQLVVH